jgi:hypothetical protein
MGSSWFWTALLVVAIAAAVLAILIGHVSLRAPAAALRLYRRHFPEPRHERLFLASVSFFVTFMMARGITHAIALRAGPFANVHFGSVHIHHLVWGILALLGVGLCWLGRSVAARPVPRPSRRASPTCSPAPARCSPWTSSRSGSCSRTCTGRRKDD